MPIRGLLTHRTAINLDFSRAGAANKELYDHFFRQILPNAYAFVEEKNGKPLESWMFFNMDETGIAPHVRPTPESGLLAKQVSTAQARSAGGQRHFRPPGARH